MADDTMATLREVARNKQFGEYVRVSQGLVTEQMVAEALRLLAENIARALVLSGQTATEGTGKVMVALASDKPWLGDADTVAAKIRSALTATPEQFIAYMGFQWKEDRDRADKTKAEYDRLMALVAEAKSMKWLRERLFHDPEAEAR